MKKISLILSIVMLINMACMLSVKAVASITPGTVMVDVNDEGFEYSDGALQSVSLKGPFGEGTYYGGEYYKWNPTLSRNISYKTYFYNYKYSSNTASACISVQNVYETDYIHIDQQNTNSGWIYLGEYVFGSDDFVMLSMDENFSGGLRASAVKFIPVNDEISEDGTAKKNEVITITPQDSDCLEYVYYSSSSVKTASGETTYFGKDECLWRPVLQGGKYKVSYYSCGNSSDSASANFEVVSAEGVISATVNMQVKGWVTLGECYFSGGDNGYVRMVGSGDSKQLRISDVKFERVCTNSLIAFGEKTLNSAGNVIDTVITDDIGYVDFNSYILNDTQEKRYVNIFAARYDNREHLSSVHTEMFELEPYSVKKIKTAISPDALGLASVGGGVRLFLWETAKMMPLSEFEKLAVEEPISREIYVSPFGAEDADGSEGKPFSSIEDAFEKLTNDAYKTDGNIQILLKGGTYVISEPIVIDENSFDIGNNTLLIKGCENEKTVISGGASISGWENVGGNLYRAAVCEGADFRQLYKNNQKQTLARKPNSELCSASGGAEYITDGISLKKGYISEVESFSNQSVHWVTVSSWTNRHYKISSLNTTTSEVCDYIMLDEDICDAYYSATGNSTVSLTASKGFFEGAKEFIDTPGEWALCDGYVYYMAEEGESINDCEFIYPIAEDNLISICGNMYDKVKNITISNIEFMHSNWSYPNESGLYDIQANMFYPPSDEKIENEQYRKGFKKLRTPAAIHAEYTENICIENCVFKNLGGSGVAFETGTDGIIIKGNEFSDISGSAIEIGNDFYKAYDFRMYPRSVLIENNYIHDIATDYMGGCGIVVFYADGVDVLNNHIKNTPYTGISVGWGWENSPPEYHRNFNVSRNIIENAMQKLYDGGYFYSPDPINGENIASGNVIIGNERTMNPSTQQNGFYFDASSSGWTLKDNVIMNVPSNYAVRKAANTTIDGVYTNNVSTVIWEDSTDEERLTQTNFCYGEDADWSEAYSGAAFEIMKNAGLTAEYAHLNNTAEIKLYAPTPTYHIHNGELTMSAVAENKTSESRNVKISLIAPEETGIETQVKDVVLKPGETRIDFNISIGGMPDYGIYPCRFVIDETEIPVYVESEPDEALTITIYDDGYEEIRGNWGVSGLADTRCGSGNSQGYAIARYTPKNLKPGKYKVWFYGVPNEANGLNPHDFVVADKNDIENTTKIYQRSIPAGWNDMGVYELDETSFVELRQTGGGVLRTSPVAFSIVELDK